MAGLNLKVGGFGGVGTTGAPSRGTQQSYDSVTSQAFGPGATTAPSGGIVNNLGPTQPAGLAFWTGVVAVVLLVVIRHSLPG
jgi:hypothetical protein